MRNHRSNIDSRVEELLSKHQIQNSPVPVKRIATDEGLMLLESPFPSDVSGALVRSGRVVAIAVNLSQHANRQRFTIAHELAHFFLKHSEGEDHLDRKFTVLRRDENSSTATDENEIQANYFAACLLMPEEFLRRDVVQFAKFNGETVLGQQEVLSLAKKYQVSPAAMGYRLVNLGLIDPVDQF
jgi:Zn-dependent peptidase ImmA (M78 family)